MVSQWPVVSDVAERLTVPVVGGVAAGRGTPAGLLRQAMRALIGETSNNWLRHPLYWAPFMTVGEVRGVGPSLPQ
jgi:CHAT domain-containing protein